MCYLLRKVEGIRELETPAVIDAINTAGKHRRTCPLGTYILELVVVDDGEQRLEPYNGTDSHHTTGQIRYLYCQIFFKSITQLTRTSTRSQRQAAARPLLQLEVLHKSWNSISLWRGLLYTR